MPLIAPSILSANFLHLGKDVDFVNKNADIFHLDIMDGVFVPNISFGFPIVEAIASTAKKPMDAHLMIIHPEKYVERFARTGVEMLSFHYEATGDNSLSVIELIKKTGMKAGIAINPDIEVEKIFPFLKVLDYVLVMSVFAGYGGQKFIETSYERIKKVKNEITRLGLGCMIEVDGGVSPVNAKKLSEVGADILVAGSSVFGSSDPENSIRMMR